VCVGTRVFLYFTLMAGCILTLRSRYLNKKPLTYKLSIQGVDPLSLYGHNDANLLSLENRYGVRVTARGDFLTVNGPPHKVHHVSGLLEEMISCLRRGDHFDPINLIAPPNRIYRDQ